MLLFIYLTDAKHMREIFIIGVLFVHVNFYALPSAMTILDRAEILQLALIYGYKARFQISRPSDEKKNTKYEMRTFTIRDIMNPHTINRLKSFTDIPVENAFLRPTMIVRL